LRCPRGLPEEVHSQLANGVLRQFGDRAVQKHLQLPVGYVDLDIVDPVAAGGVVDDQVGRAFRFRGQEHRTGRTHRSVGDVRLGDGDRAHVVGGSDDGGMPDGDPDLLASLGGQRDGGEHQHQEQRHRGASHHILEIRG
jgi:hypothetical protein